MRVARFIALFVLLLIAVASRTFVNHDSLQTSPVVEATLPSEGDSMRSGPTTEEKSTPDKSTRRVFRLVLENGTCKLDAVEEVTGDFRRRRGTSNVYAGMLSCQVVDASDHVLEQQWLHPPDRVCRVLDEGVDGAPPRMSTYAGVGPQVFQVRFPIAAKATTLNVYRVLQTEPELQRERLLSLPFHP